MSIPLRPHEAQCLEYIIAYVAEQGFSPTYRQIAAGCRIKSVSGVFRMLVRLEEAGYVKRSGSQRRGAIEVLDQNKCPHCGYPIGSSLCRESAKRNITYSTTPLPTEVAA